MKILCYLLLFFTNGYSYTKEVLQESPRVFLFTDFLTSEECDYLVEFASPYLMRSQVVDESRPHGEILDSRRTSAGMFFPQFSHDRIIQTIEQRIATLTEIPLENGEGLQVLHYDVGGEYVPHFDYFNPNTAGGASNLLRGGQRVATLIMYLNTPQEGGETIFPSLGLKVTPKKGNALLFYNCTPNGAVDPRTLHGGAPVKAGEKWIATKWLHERPFH